MRYEYLWGVFLPVGIFIQIVELFLQLRMTRRRSWRWSEMNNTERGRGGIWIFSSCPPPFTSNPHYTQKRQLEMCIEIRNSGKVLLGILCNYMLLNIWKRGMLEMWVNQAGPDQANNKSQWFHLKCTQSQSKLYYWSSESRNVHWK